VFSPLVLAALLGYAFWLMPALRPLPDPAAASTALRIEVTGEQFWWRVSYRRGETGAPVASANEIRLPVGERVEFVLTSSDVIHSFWIPSLGGKMDMIPGRTNRLSLKATKPGMFRGPCAEYCGTSHALMAFTAVAMPPADFEAWLAQKSASSPGAAGPGLAAFLGNGCGACHAVKGTDARGVIGPDLSHIGSRETLGAGILPNTEAELARFIARPAAFKPAARMPGYAMLPDEELRTIAAWLKGLR
jgi:cytochrome c oxidase subunit 2